MIAIQFLAEWALRSSILILSGALLLWAMRIKDPSVRLAAWTAMLLGSLAIPTLTQALPKAPFTGIRFAARPAAQPVLTYDAAHTPAHPMSGKDLAFPIPTDLGASRFGWARAPAKCTSASRSGMSRSSEARLSGKRSTNTSNSSLRLKSGKSSTSCFRR